MKSNENLQILIIKIRMNHRKHLHLLNHHNIHL